MEKEHLIYLVEKTMRIQNEGGIEKKLTIPKNKKEQENKSENKVKTSGGVLFSLIRSESGLNKAEIKKIFTKDTKLNNEKKKIMRKMDKLLLNC